MAREGRQCLAPALANFKIQAASLTAPYESPQWQRSPEALRDQLTSDETDARRNAVARFIGRAAHEHAGGGVRRDMFADEQTGVFLTDGALLDALAERVRAEGWGCSGSKGWGSLSGRM